jgi:Na+/H+ antiporter NhaC
LGELKTIVAKIESGILHVPQELRQILGHNTKIIVGTAAVIAFSAGTSYADVLISLELIQDDVQLRLAKEKSDIKNKKRLAGASAQLPRA